MKSTVKRRMSLTGAVVGAALAALWAADQASAEAGRVALVIGNSHHAHAPALATPANDAADVGAALGRLGFAVTHVEDGGQTDLRLALQEFARAAAGADAALVFYAGHGLRVDRRNFLVPADAQLASEHDVEFETVPLDLVLRAVGRASGLRLVILDGSRANPLATAMQEAGAERTVASGLGPVEPPAETVVVVAARTTSVDVEGRNSAYAAALLAHLERPGLDLDDLLEEVRVAVLAATDGRQEPVAYGGRAGEPVLLAGPLAGDAPTTRLAAEELATERVFWSSVMDSDNPADLRAYLNRYPEGTFAALASNRLQAREMRAPEAEAQVSNGSLGPVRSATPEPAGGETMLQRRDRRRIQVALATLGFDPGPADGLFGRRTRNAIGRWQAAMGGADTGVLDAEEIRSLLTVTESAFAGEQRAWAQANEVGAPSDLQAYLTAYPDGVFALLARRGLERAQAGHDEDAFVRARSEGTMAAYLAYLAAHPDGLHAEAAWDEAERLRMVEMSGRTGQECDDCP